MLPRRIEGEVDGGGGTRADRILRLDAGAGRGGRILCGRRPLVEHVQAEIATCSDQHRPSQNPDQHSPTARRCGLRHHTGSGDLPRSGLGHRDINSRQLRNGQGGELTDRSSSRRAPAVADETGPRLRMAAAGPTGILVGELVRADRDGVHEFGAGVGRLIGFVAVRRGLQNVDRGDR